MNEAIRILHVFGELNRGGAETMVMNIYRKIDRSKVQFDFVVHTKEKCNYDDEIERLGGRIFRICRYKGINHLDYINQWNDFFLNYKEHVIIHGHVRSTASLYLRIAKKYNRIAIAHSHNTSSGNGLVAIIKDIMQIPIRFTADYYFACSKLAGQWLFGKRVCLNKNFYVLNNAIDVNSFVFNYELRKSKRLELGIKDEFVVGHIGRFEEQKNHSSIIKIFNEIYKKNRKSKLILVGDGKLKKQIENKVMQYNLEGIVIFTGMREDIPELLQAMDVFLFPSLFEGLGIVAIEAQAAGLPCVVSDILPEEACVTSLIKKHSISEPIENWADEVLKQKNYKRKDLSNIIKNAGYEIVDTTKWLEEFYIQKVKENEKI